MGTQGGQSRQTKEKVNQEPKKQNQRTKNQKNEANKWNMLGCLYTNADTLTNKFDELKDRIKDHEPAIICITEVKPKHMKGNLLNSEFSLKNMGY